MNPVACPERRAKESPQTLPHRGGWRVKALLPLVVCLILSRCGFQPHSAARLPEPLRSLTVESSDPYGPLARAVQAQLRHYGFTLVEQSDHPILQLHLLNASEERSCRSVFSDGKGAQYQLIYRITAQLQWRDQHPQTTQSNPDRRIPLSTAVAQSFFDNPQAALAKSVEQEIIQRQLCQQAADQLAVQLLLLLSETSGSAPASMPLSPSVDEHATPDA